MHSTQHSPHQRRPSALAGAAAFACAVALIAGLTGCQTPPAAAESPPNTAGTPEAPVATETVPDEPSADTPAPECETVLTGAENARLAADGFLPTEVNPLGSTMEEMLNLGGFGCQWSKGTASDVTVWYAQQPLSAEAWTVRQTGLMAAGFSISDTPMRGTLLAPWDYDANYQPSVYYEDGLLHFVSYAPLLNVVAELESR